MYPLSVAIDMHGTNESTESETLTKDILSFADATLMIDDLDAFIVRPSSSSSPKSTHKTDENSRRNVRACPCAVRRRGHITGHTL